MLTFVMEMRLTKDTRHSGAAPEHEASTNFHARRRDQCRDTRGLCRRPAELAQQGAMGHRRTRALGICVSGLELGFVRGGQVLRVFIRGIELKGPKNRFSNITTNILGQHPYAAIQTRGSWILVEATASKYHKTKRSLVAAEATRRLRQPRRCPGPRRARLPPPGQRSRGPWEVPPPPFVVAPLWGSSRSLLSPLVAPAQEQALNTAESLPPKRVGRVDDDGMTEQERFRLRSSKSDLHDWRKQTRRSLIAAQGTAPPPILPLPLLRPLNPHDVVIRADRVSFIGSKRGRRD